MTYTEILFEPDAAGFVQVTIHRPQKLNALSNRVMAELDDAFQSVEREHRGLIFTGAGERAFVAGADIEELWGISPLEGQARCARDQAIMRRLGSMRKPSIAAINGYAPAPSFANASRHFSTGAANECDHGQAFIDIAQKARKVVFCGTLAVRGGKPKFVPAVRQITFSGANAVATGQEVLYVTEAAVFRLTAEGLRLEEVAPGLDIERDVIAKMAFRPLTGASAGTIRAELFAPALLPADCFPAFP